VLLSETLVASPYTSAVNSTVPSPIVLVVAAFARFKVPRLESLIVRKYRISLHRCAVAPLSRHQLRLKLSDLVDEVFKQTLFAHLTFSLPFLL
jgi:hypothetical protein